MRQNKTAIFIDGANAYATARALRLDIDYSRLLKYFGDSVIRALYYTAITEEENKEVTIRPLIDWLGYNGFTVVSKPSKEFVDSQGRKKIKGNMDIEIAVDALELAPSIDHAVIFSGDGDFISLVEALHRAGLRVTVVSSIVSAPPMCADDLRRVADTFLDLSDLREHVQRTRDDRSRYA